MDEYDHFDPEHVHDPKHPVHIRHHEFIHSRIEGHVTWHKRWERVMDALLVWLAVGVATVIVSGVLLLLKDKVS